MVTDIRAAARRGSAATALAVLLLSACGSGFDPNGDTAGKPSETAEESLHLGQPSRHLVELSRWGKDGMFRITPQRVVMGKESDLKELDDMQYTDLVPAWVYVNAKLVGGDSPIKGAYVMSDVGVLTERAQPVKQLLVMGSDLSSMPADCKEDDPDQRWKKGDDHTRCALFLVPKGEKATHVLYSRGYYEAPLKWAVK
ncbi:hypothetical protein [Streptomyces sp. NPDC048638]|uniref:hypothetical protein n=1 Tax=Streptomyces sp. NPDC048638 TaxID=3365580 RepID=UPI00371CCE7D